MNKSDPTRFMLTLALLVLIWILIVPAPGAQSATGKLDAEAIIEECWSLSKKERASGVTATMRAGAAKSVACLREKLIGLSAKMFDHAVYSESEIRQDIETLSRSIGAFSFNLYNHPKHCFPACGTMYQLFHHGHQAEILEKMIERTVAEYNQWIAD